MEGGMAMGHGMSMPSPPSSISSTSSKNGGGMMMHMTFFWGDKTQILFTGWPGNRGIGMYLLSLLAILILAAVTEFLQVAARRLTSRRHISSTVSLGLFLTLLHAFNMGLAYLVMLAVMSFNGGVFLAAVAGHAIGYLVSGSGIFVKNEHLATRPGNGPKAPSGNCSC